MAAPMGTEAALPGGAAPHGNFPDYSRFHPPESRVCLLPGALLGRLFPAPRGPRPLLGLDVGCNSGELSVALYKHLLGLDDNETSSHQPAVGTDLKLLCCDIDAALVERAKQRSPFPTSISYTALDIMDPSARETLSSYLTRFGCSSFDLCFCMSVTMWIHLNHGDAGLVEFLSYLSSLCMYLLVEPQPWKCYRAAARRLRKLGRNDFDHFRSLAISGDMAEKITQILTKDGAMELVCCFGNTSRDRSLFLFKSTGVTGQRGSNG
uniref:RNA methyltransferase n=1 Tax=Sphenodon punctatus TaxID=8508 RepID=A0A8D0GNQ0_SPHPU